MNLLILILSVVTLATLATTQCTQETFVLSSDADTDALSSCDTLVGDVVVSRGFTGSLFLGYNLEELQGDLICEGNAQISSIQIPSLKKATGEIRITGCDNLTSIRIGDVSDTYGDPLTAHSIIVEDNEPSLYLELPALRYVTKDLSIKGAGSFDLTALRSVSNDMTLTNTSAYWQSLEDLSQVNGSLRLRNVWIDTDDFNIPNIVRLDELYSVGGRIEVYHWQEITAVKLRSLNRAQGIDVAGSISPIPESIDLGDGGLETLGYINIRSVYNNFDCCNYAYMNLSRDADVYCQINMTLPEDPSDYSAWPMFETEETGTNFKKCRNKEDPADDDNGGGGGSSGGSSGGSGSYSGGGMDLKLKGGKLAGIIAGSVGSVVLAITMWVCCRKRKKAEKPETAQHSTTPAAPATAQTLPTTHAPGTVYNTSTGQTYKKANVVTSPVSPLSSTYSPPQDAYRQNSAFTGPQTTYR